MTVKLNVLVLFLCKSIFEKKLKMGIIEKCLLWHIYYCAM